MSDQSAAAEKEAAAPAAATEEQTAADIWNELEADDLAKAGKEPESGDDEKDIDAVESTAKADDSQPDKAEQGDDVWAQATPEQIAERDRLLQQARSANGRYAASQRIINELRTKEAAQAAMAPQRENERKQRRAAVNQELSQLESEYPEIARPLKSIVTTYDDEVNELRNAEMERLQAAQRIQQAEIAAETQELDRRLPEWRQVVKKDPASLSAFKEWVDNQPRPIRDAAIRNANSIVNADEAEFVLSSYLKHIQPPAANAQGNPNPSRQTQNRRQQQLAASATPSRSSNPVPSASPADDPQAWWDHFEAEDRRKAARA